MVLSLPSWCAPVRCRSTSSGELQKSECMEKKGRGAKIFSLKTLAAQELLIEAKTSRCLPPRQNQKTQTTSDRLFAGTLNGAKRLYTFNASSTSDTPLMNMS